MDEDKARRARNALPIGSEYEALLSELKLQQLRLIDNSLDTIALALLMQIPPAIASVVAEAAAPLEVSERWMEQIIEMGEKHKEARAKIHSGDDV